MSELHSYALTWGDPSRGTVVRAFTAADAVAQLKSARPWDCAPMCPVNIEPLPDAPEPHLSEKQREWLRVLDETTGTIPGLTVEAYKLDALAKRIAKLESALGLAEFQGVPVVPDAPTLEHAQAEAQRPVKSIAYANAQLDEMAKERDRLRAEQEIMKNGWVAKQIERYKEGYNELPVERDKLRNVIGDRDALQKRLEAMAAERDNAIADQKWARSIVEESRADADKARKGWDAAIADRDKLKLRIDAAKAHLTGANLPHGSDLLAILEGREP